MAAPSAALRRLPRQPALPARRALRLGPQLPAEDARMGQRFPGGEDRRGLPLHGRRRLAHGRDLRSGPAPRLGALRHGDAGGRWRRHALRGHVPRLRAPLRAHAALPRRADGGPRRRPALRRRLRDPAAGGTAVPAQRAPGGGPPSGNGAETALRELRLHEPRQGPETEGEPCPPRPAVPAHRGHTAPHLPRALDARDADPLGQPLHAAPCGLGLPSARPLRRARLHRRRGRTGGPTTLAPRIGW